MYKKLSGFSDEIASDINTQFEALEKLGMEYFEPRSVDGKNISELDDSEVLALKAKIKLQALVLQLEKLKLQMI